MMNKGRTDGPNVTNELQVLLASLGHKFFPILLFLINIVIFVEIRSTTFLLANLASMWQNRVRLGYPIFL
jgi:hypothetical protein